MRQPLTLLILLIAGSAALAESPSHPFATGQQSILGLEQSSLLEWGPSTLGFSQTWSGGESRSQGFLLKEFRSQLHPTLEFRARFGMSFQPSAMSGRQDGNARFELPEATLTWRPGKDTMIRLQFQQGSVWQSRGVFDDPVLGEFGYGRPNPFGETP